MLKLPKLRCMSAKLPKLPKLLKLPKLPKLPNRFSCDIIAIFRAILR